VRALIIAALALCVAACAKPLPPGVTELTYATPYGPGHPFSKADKAWMDFVAKRSGGTLRIRPNWSGALLSSDMSMEELRHGIADIGLITPIYTRGGVHLNRIQTGFYAGADSIPSQVALYRCIVAADPQVERELGGLKILATQGGSLPGIVSTSRPVRSLGDLKGMRIRAPTELLNVLGALGADAVDMPMGEVYPAMAKGVIDGVIAPADTFKALHFDEVAHYFTTLKVPRGAYPARAMGMARWNSLTPAQRDILNEGTGVWEAALNREISAAWHTGYAVAVKSGIQIMPVTPADQADFDRIYQREAERNARALAPLGIDAVKTLNIARASIAGRDRIACRSAA
jgi:TRAP-type C4-dicarboxylate transport system substrate-binding protein